MIKVMSLSPASRLDGFGP
ncbi:hypothetical protein CEXT_41971, partial [Caerostris extrusa]